MLNPVCLPFGDAHRVSVSPWGGARDLRVRFVGAPHSSDSKLMRENGRVEAISSSVTVVDLHAAAAALGGALASSDHSLQGSDVYTDHIGYQMHTALELDESVAMRTINVEGWQLALTAVAILAGSYFFAWDSHKALLTEISGLRQDMRGDKSSADGDLKALIAELKAEREADRQQAKVDNEALQESLSKIREAQAATAEALKHLKK